MHLLVLCNLPPLRQVVSGREYGPETEAEKERVRHWRGSHRLNNSLCKGGRKREEDCLVGGKLLDDGSPVAGILCPSNYANAYSNAHTYFYINANTYSYSRCGYGKGQAHEAGRDSSYTTLITNRSSYGTPFDPAPFRLGGAYNTSLIDDPRILGAYDQCKENFFDPIAQVRILKEAAPYILSQSFYVHEVLPYTYTVWWPWLKNFQGEYSLGTGGSEGWSRWAWIDQNLKRDMTSRK